MSVNKKLLAYLQGGGNITAYEALNMWGTMRLAARVHDLRCEGHDVEMEYIESASGARFANYYLKGVQSNASVDKSAN